jgi:hypothetical protein
VHDLGRLLIVFGVVLVIAGLLLTLGGRIPWLGRLPGDINIQRGSWTFYFPLMTSLVVSIVLSLLLYLIGRR